MKTSKQVPLILLAIFGILFIIGFGKGLTDKTAKSKVKTETSSKGGFIYDPIFSYIEEDAYFMRSHLGEPNEFAYNIANMSVALYYRENGTITFGYDRVTNKMLAVCRTIKYTTEADAVIAAAEMMSELKDEGYLCTNSTEDNAFFLKDKYIFEIKTAEGNNVWMITLAISRS